MKNKAKILEEFEMKQGLEIDLDEGWHKLANRQFGGSPGRAFAELIQNLIDSYPPGLPMNERKGIIETTSGSISITDFGSGMNLDKVKLIKTLGGTDKADDSTKIGQFGLGFFSIFNKRLETTSVVVTTRCEGSVIRIVFTVADPDKRPLVSIEILDEKISYSTRIDVNFANRNSVGLCLEQATKSLTWYPCKITVNGKLFESVWLEAHTKSLNYFNDGYCEGFFKSGFHRQWMTVLCKYEFVMDLTINGLICGTDKPSYNLCDFEQKQTPCLPDISIVVNCNNLSLTISRDSFYLNNYYERMMDRLIRELYKLLNARKFESDSQLVLANLYSLQHEVRSCVSNSVLFSLDFQDKQEVIKRLAEAPVFRITSSKNPVSLMEIKKRMTPGLPLFYSPNKANLEWLGGNFRHDFILLPERCHINNGAPGFYNKMLKYLFNDIVNLDEILGDNHLIKELLQRGIVSEEALTPDIKFVGEKRLTGSEAEFLDQINLMLEKPAVRKVIETNLYLSIASIKAVFFEIHKEGALISTGLFDSHYKPISEDFITNLKKAEETDLYEDKPVNIMLGLQKNHPLISELIESKNQHKLYYALTYIAHELAYCQKLLVPHSPFFHFTKEKIASEMRKALMSELMDYAA